MPVLSERILVFSNHTIFGHIGAIILRIHNTCRDVGGNLMVLSVKSVELIGFSLGYGRKQLELTKGESLYSDNFIHFNVPRGGGLNPQMSSPDPPEKAGRGRVEKPVTDRQ